MFRELANPAPALQFFSPTKTGREGLLKILSACGE